LILEQAIAAREAMRGTGPRVTVVNPATGDVSTGALPSYKSPASRALWQPMMEKVREKIKARGLEKAMTLGIMNDMLPPKEDMQFFADLWPGVPWVQHAHSGPRFGEAVHGVASLGYKAIVWTVRFSPDKSLAGWKGPHLLAYYDRDRELNAHTPIVWAHLVEVSITGDQRGVGRVGADYWPVVKDASGRRRAFVWQRYPQSSWRNLDLWSYALGPGPDGPAAIAPYEYLREGIQLCEARIAIEEALTDQALREKLGEELALRCQAALDLRQWAMVKALAHHQMNDTVNRVIQAWHGGPEVVGHTWFPGSGWQQRNEDLFSLAAEVARKTAGAERAGVSK
jgi:hypothetical protein